MKVIYTPAHLQHDPHVEIESCSSGGARIDHEILRRTERVWTSDCNDALERQVIQRGASMLIPPELMGAHIGPERSHTTGRRHDLTTVQREATGERIGLAVGTADELNKSAPTDSHPVGSARVDDGLRDRLKRWGFLALLRF